VVVQTSLGSHETSQTAGEHKGRQSKFELDIPLQEHNHFTNCFMECIGIQQSLRSCETSQGECWAVGENHAKKVKIKLDIPQQESNSLVGGFHGVYRYPKEPGVM